MRGGARGECRLYYIEFKIRVTYAHLPLLGLVAFNFGSMNYLRAGLASIREFVSEPFFDPHSTKVEDVTGEDVRMATDIIEPGFEQGIAQTRQRRKPTFCVASWNCQSRKRANNKMQRQCDAVDKG